MDKIITIAGRQVGFRATALTPRLYRHRMGRDIIRDLNQLRRSFSKAASLSKDATAEEREEAQLSMLDLEIFENIAWLMARQYDPTVPDSPEEWLEGFSMFSIYTIMPEILELWDANQLTTAKPKKKIRPTVREETGSTFMLRCAELGLTREDLEEMTMGMVYDMIIERANDQEEYNYKATQEDITAFFGGD